MVKDNMANTKEVVYNEDSKYKYFERRRIKEYGIECPICDKIIYGRTFSHRNYNFEVHMQKHEREKEEVEVEGPISATEDFNDKKEVYENDNP